MGASGVENDILRALYGQYFAAPNAEDVETIHIWSRLDFDQFEKLLSSLRDRGLIRDDETIPKYGYEITLRGILAVENQNIANNELIQKNRQVRTLIIERLAHSYEQRQDDGDLHYTEIAQEVALDDHTVLNNVRMLEEAGKIKTTPLGRYLVTQLGLGSYYGEKSSKEIQEQIEPTSKTTSHDSRPEPERLFQPMSTSSDTVAATGRIAVVRAQLTDESRGVVNAIWQYYLDKDTWIRSTRLRYRVGREIAAAGLNSLDPLIGREKKGPDGDFCCLNALGPLVTDQGPELEAWGHAYLALVRKKLESDLELREIRIDWREVLPALGVSETQSQAVFQFLQVVRLDGGGWRNGKEWNTGVPFYLETVLEADDLQVYFEEHVFRESERALKSDYYGAATQFVVGELPVDSRSSLSDRDLMLRAIELAKKCKSEPGKVSPRVGAIVARDGLILGEAYRGEIEPGEHAEFTLLEKKLSGVTLAGATLFTTLEPCTSRNPPKTACAKWIIERRIGKVFIGTLDRNPKILGYGETSMIDAGIQIARFDPDLIFVLDELNRDFLRQYRGDVGRTGTAAETKDPPGTIEENTTARHISNKDAARKLGIPANLKLGETTMKGDPIATTENITLEEARRRQKTVPTEKIDDTYYKTVHRDYTIHTRKNGVLWQNWYDPIPKKWANSGGAVIEYNSPEEAVESGVRTIDALLEDERPVLFGSSTELFSERTARAFPGVRGLRRIDDPEEGIRRLALVLQAPLVFALVGGGLAEPIWWWRGSNSSIRDFKALTRTKCLLNHDELEIDCVVVYRSSSYFRDFVYVQAKAEPPIGLYDYTGSDIDRQVSHFGYASEEYGLFGETPISRAEYDDGAAEINGQIVRTWDKAELRVRYLTPYNVLIAPQESPVNSHHFDGTLEALLNGLLVGRVELTELVETVKALPRGRDDD